MKETDNQADPGEIQRDEKKPESRGMALIRKVTATAAFIFFAFIIAGAIMRKCGG